MKKELLRIDNGRLHINLYEALRGVYLNVLAGEALGILFANLYEKEAFIKVLRGTRPSPPAGCTSTRKS